MVWAAGSAVRPPVYSLHFYSLNQPRLGQLLGPPSGEKRHLVEGITETDLESFDGYSLEVYKLFSAPHHLL